MKFKNLSDDLLLEILCKLKYDSLNIFFIDNWMYSIYRYNKRYIYKKIVNSYNWLFTDETNLSFIKAYNIITLDYNPYFDVCYSQLHIEIEYNHLNNVKLLLKNYIHSIIDIDSLLILAAELGYLEIMKILIGYGANVNTSEGEALHWSCHYNRVDIVNFLLEKGIDPCIGDNKALKWASDAGCTDVIKLLIEAGVDVQIQNNYALIHASHFGHIKTVQLLLEHGADIHTGEDLALRRASSCGHTEVTRLLLDHGANIHTNSGSALTEASRYNHTEIINLLKSKLSKIV